ncbi:hypothetical protein, unknown function [Leishmania mexicana MHOM/GT/2001/U1103]|uniref:Transmembrane protein n=1 Tax=Leishmania mexicana (strain MHOM/GT/2001/U1103) TaxID=929439 RepID=E9AS89_LEIMU|nr:hypothetical protein, unknown function [Leishmania mexicana MHOM/GT/2001/U1103]CBZ25810.1 hypothetical protein, unknown function [Leishmania mexicana MHOM/GT/2001/U1103]
MNGSAHTHNRIGTSYISHSPFSALSARSTSLFYVCLWRFYSPKSPETDTSHAHTLSGCARPSCTKQIATCCTMASRASLLSLACVGIAIVILLVCAQSVVAQGDEPSAAFSQQGAPESEKDQHLLRLVVILLPVMFVLWFILCIILAYIYICVCPKYYAK